MSVLVAVCVCFALSFLPVQTFKIDTVLERNSLVTGSDPVKRVVEACQTLQLNGRIEQIVRQDSGVAILFSSNQTDLNEVVYEDIYNVLYQVFTIANVPSVALKVIKSQNSKEICRIEADQSALTNPLPKKADIASYLLQHFTVHLP
jgi:hypothetical protein